MSIGENEVVIVQETNRFLEYLEIQMKFFIGIWIVSLHCGTVIETVFATS